MVKYIADLGSENFIPRRFTNFCHWEGMYMQQFFEFKKLLKADDLSRRILLWQSDCFRAKQFLKEKREEDTAAAIEVIKRYM